MNVTSLSDLVAEMRALGVVEYHNAGLVVRLGPAPIKPVEREEENKPAVNPQEEAMKMLTRHSSINIWPKK